MITARAANGYGIAQCPRWLSHHFSAGFVRGATLTDVEKCRPRLLAYRRCKVRRLTKVQLAAGRHLSSCWIRLKADAASPRCSTPLGGRLPHATRRHITAISKSEEILRWQTSAAAQGRSCRRPRQATVARANTLTHFVAEKDGVFIAMETLGLSRQFQPLNGWIIEPIAVHWPKSVEGSLTVLPHSPSASLPRRNLPAPEGYTRLLVMARRAVRRRTATAAAFGRSATDLRRRVDF